MLDFLIKKNEYNKLQIITALLTRSVQTKSELDSLIDISASSSYRNINMLNGELSSIEEVAGTMIFMDGDTLSLYLPKGVRDYEVIKQLAVRYLGASPLYKMMKLINSNYSQNSLVLSEDLSVSESYLYKLMKEFNVFLRLHQLS